MAVLPPAPSALPAEVSLDVVLVLGAKRGVKARFDRYHSPRSRYTRVIARRCSADIGYSLSGDHLLPPYPAPQFSQ
jgi:hypothetical protein